MNQKVKRLLDSIAIVMKDEDRRLLDKVHAVICDELDGYDYDFISACLTARNFIKGKSY